jgi:hypothetical protein
VCQLACLICECVRGYQQTSYDAISVSPYFGHCIQSLKNACCLGPACYECLVFDLKLGGSEI